MECSCNQDGKSACFSQSCTCILAMATVPRQTFGAVYEPQEALKRGTIFRDLDLPFYVGGGNDGRQEWIVK